MPTDLQNGLVLHLPLNDGKLSTKCRDISKYQNHGVISGAIAVRPYNDMSNISEEEGEAPLVIIDDGGAAFWTLIAGVGTDDTGTVKKGLNSYKVALTTDTLDMYHDYGADQDWTKYDFITLWIYGCNTADTITLYVYNEVYAGKTNGYSYAITDDFTGWRRFIIPRGIFSDVAVPTGWNHVRCIELLGGAPQTCDYFFDRITMDVGNWRFGDTMRFDGTNDIITVGDIGTISAFGFWLYYDSQSGSILELSDDDIYFSINAGVITLTGFSGETIYTNGKKTANLSSGWNFIFVTFTELSADGVIIGEANTSYYTGLLSQIRAYNRQPIVEEVMALYKEKEIDLQRGLVLDLPMNEGSGEEVKDRSKHQNHGTIQGGATWDGNELDFDGGADHIEIADSPSLNPTDKITILAWVRVDSVGDIPHMAFVSKGTESGGANDAWRVWYNSNSNQLQAQVIIDGTAYVSGANGFVAGEYILVGLRYDRQTVEVIMNGKFAGTSHPSAIGSLSVSSEVLRIGRGHTTKYMDGVIKKVKIYNRALSMEELRALYLKGV